MRLFLLALLATSASLCSAGNALSQPTTTYEYYQIGDTTFAPARAPQPGLMLVGGGEWPRSAFRWFADKAGNGHILILRASGAAEAGEEMFNDIGNMASVRTLVFHDRTAAEDPEVLTLLANADGIFIAGGDQANYVRYWKDTPVQKALNDHVASGRPIGGTSAGLAILGAYAYGAMDGGSVDTFSALRDPMGPQVTMVTDFLTMPYLQHAVTDTHFAVRDRLGRLIAFVAQIRATRDNQAIGIGVDEDGALTVEADGKARFHTLNKGFAWIVLPQEQPLSGQGQPLDMAGVRVVTVGIDSELDLNTLEVARPAFEGIARVEQGRLLDAPFDPDAPWSLALHGGAADHTRATLSPEQDALYRQTLQQALRAGQDVLATGGSSLDAVEASVRVLEDNPLFNAARGAALNAEGAVMLEAAIMDGTLRDAAGVSGVQTTRNPVSLARTLMERSPHIMLGGQPADALARQHALEQVEPAYFHTEVRLAEHLSRQSSPSAALHGYGTVGAVAMDKYGHVSAASSSGGTPGKPSGHIGHAAVIGAGTYAANGQCAVSTSGTSEHLIMATAARQVCDRMRWNDEDVAEAARNTVEHISELGGTGAIVAIDGKGRVGFALNSPSLYRAAVTSSSTPVVHIYADEGRSELK